MSLFIQNNSGPIYNECNVTIHNGQTTIRQPENIAAKHDNVQTDEVQPIDTSFFCTKQFTEDIIEKNIRQAITLASSKADVCRRIMALETQGYVILSNVTDERKAELINPFAMPKYSLTGQDFRQARNR